MPRSQYATAERVAEVAASLLTAGQEPTIRRVRAELGGGSESTILRHLQSWAAKRQSTSSKAEFSPELLAALATDQKRVIAAAVTAQRTKIQALEANLETLQRALDQATGELEETEQRFAAKRDQLLKLETIHEHTQQALGQSKETVDDLRKRLVNAEQARAVAEAEVKLIKTLRGPLVRNEGGVRDKQPAGRAKLKRRSRT